MKERLAALRFGAWFFVLNLPLVILGALRYLSFAPPELRFPVMAYLLIAMAGHFAFVLFIPYALVYAPLVLLFPRGRLFFAAGVVSAGLLAMAVDTFVFALYRFHLNGFTLDLLFGGAAGDIFELHWATYLQALLILTVIVGVETGLARWAVRRLAAGNLKRGGLVAIALFLALAGAHLTHAVAEAAYYRPITQVSRVFPLFYPLQAKKFLYGRGLIDKEKAAQRAVSVDHTVRALAYPRVPLTFDSAPAAPFNILWILVDSWHHAMLDEKIMPRLYAFSRSASRFTRHASGSNGTRGGVFSLFYGLPALYWYDVEACQASPAMIDALLNHGYAMEIHASAALTSPPFDRTVFVRVKNLNLSSREGKAFERDAEITSEWLAFTRRRASTPSSNPFFGFLFYDALHAVRHPPDFKGPFQPAWDFANYAALAGAEKEERYFNLYRNTAYYADSLIGLVLSDLNSRGLLENTAVLVTGDHGQEFNDNGKGFWGHNGNFTFAQIGVPLVLYWPGRPPLEYRHWTTHFDIVPTFLAGLLHCQNPPADYCIGRSLFDSSALAWSVAGSKDNFAMIEPGRLTVVDYDGTVDIRDPSWGLLPAARLDAAKFGEMMKAVNRFYYGSAP